MVHACPNIHDFTLQAKQSSTQTWPAKKYECTTLRRITGTCTAQSLYEDSVLLLWIKMSVLLINNDVQALDFTLVVRYSLSEEGVPLKSSPWIERLV